jgi:ubiquinone/menaquinone biosynthesis C-methylase UbiE
VGASNALDIGCGDGKTLLDHAASFKAGTGYDQSSYALELARRDATSRGIANVQFLRGKAVQLPFADDSFDFIFSERGPIGHSDLTMAEALRVLRPGGRIFYETGAWAGEGRTLLTNLAEERDRIERFGVQPEILANRMEEHRFDDLYVWFEIQCITWRYLEQEPPFPYSEQSLKELADSAGGPDHAIVTTHQSIWVGGQKGARG